MIVQSEVLKGALEIAVITRLILKSFNIAESDESLGMKVVDDPDSPDYGRIPIPAPLDAQLDRMWMEKMARIKKRTLGLLNKMMIGTRKRENWYIIFLTVLVLLHNLEAVYRHQLREREAYQKTVSTTSRHILVLYR